MERLLALKHRKALEYSGSMPIGCGIGRISEHGSMTLLSPDRNFAEATWVVRITAKNMCSIAVEKALKVVQVFVTHRMIDEDCLELASAIQYHCPQTSPLLRLLRSLPRCPA